MTSFKLDSFLPYELAVISSRVSRRFAEIYSAKFGLTIPEWRVVVHLHSAGPVSVREIQARVDMDKSKVSRAASRLETAGLITKEINTDDRRLLKLALTRKGRNLMAKIEPLAIAYESDLMTQLGPNADSFRAALSKFLKDTQ